jgi:hypothetical protein
MFQSIWIIFREPTLVLAKVTLFQILPLKCSVKRFSVPWFRLLTFYMVNKMCIFWSEKLWYYRNARYYNDKKMKTNVHFRSYLAQFFLEGNIFRTKYVEEIKTNIFCSVIFPFFENRKVYEVMWKNIVEQDSPHMTIWRMRLACWITKATNTHTKVVIILIAFPQQQWF